MNIVPGGKSHWLSPLPMWRDFIPNAPPQHLTFALQNRITSKINCIILNLIERVEELNAFDTQQAHDIAVKAIKAFQPVELPDALAERFYKAIIGAGVIEKAEAEELRKGQKKTPISLKDAVALGFDEKAIDMYMRAAPTVQENYLLSDDAKRFCELCCRFAGKYDGAEREVLYRIIGNHIHGNLDFVEVRPETGTSPLEDLIESGGNVNDLMKHVNYTTRVRRSTDYRSAVNPNEYYINIDRGTLILLLSTQHFRKHVLELCLQAHNAGQVAEGSLVFPFLFGSVMTAFSHYISDWVRDHKELLEAPYENPLIDSLHLFTHEQKEDFLVNLEENVAKTVKVSYRGKYEEQMNARLNPLLDQYKAFEKAAVASPEQESRSFTVETLTQTAGDRFLSPEQRLAALDRLSQTEKFQQLSPQDRIPFFTDICKAATTKIESIRQLVQGLERELALSDQPIKEKTTSLRKMQANLLTLVRRVQGRAREHLPGAYTTIIQADQQIVEAGHLRGQWKTLYQALQDLFQGKGYEIDFSRTELDLDQLFEYVFVHKGCGASLDGVLQTLQELGSDTPDDLAKAIAFPK